MATWLALVGNITGNLCFLAISLVVHNFCTAAVSCKIIADIHESGFSGLNTCNPGQ